MSVREEVKRFASLGRLPREKDADPEMIDRHADALEKITDPVTREEAEVLMECFPNSDESCYGVAWSLLHLIETAPGGPMLSSPPPSDANEWLHRMWTGIENARRWGKSK